MEEVDPILYFKENPGLVEERGRLGGVPCPKCGAIRTMINFLHHRRSDVRVTFFSQCGTCRTTWRLTLEEAQEAFNGRRFWDRLARQH
jgi:hypothetical protein